MSFRINRRYNRIDKRNYKKHPKGSIHPCPIGSNIDSKYQKADSNNPKCETRLAAMRLFTFPILIQMFAFLLRGPEISVVEKVSPLPQTEDN